MSPKSDLPPESAGAPDFDMESVEVELAAGARAFAFKDYSAATECFSKACEALSVHYGDRHPALVDAHISYGKALLRNAIALSSVLGGAPHTRGFDGAEEKDEPSECASSAGAQAAGSTSKVPKAVKGATNPRIQFSGDSSDEDEVGDDAGDSEDAEQPEQAISVEDELENAFQVLETARLCLQAQLDSNPEQQTPDQAKQLATKLCLVYDLLAEVHQESEHFELAVDSYISSLQVKQTTPGDAFPPGAIAESHLMIALALELNPNDDSSLEKAIDHVDQAIDLMKRRLEALLAQSQTTDASAESAAAVSPMVQASSQPATQSEIDEVKSLIAELELKRDELKTVPQAPPMTDKEKVLQAYLAAVTTPTIDASGKPVVNDLSSLVRKRPRAVEAISASSTNQSGSADLQDVERSPSKKAKTEA